MSFMVFGMFGKTGGGLLPVVRETLRRHLSSGKGGNYNDGVPVVDASVTVHLGTQVQCVCVCVMGIKYSLSLCVCIMEISYSHSLFFVCKCMYNENKIFCVSNSLWV